MKTSFTTPAGHTVYARAGAKSNGTQAAAGRAWAIDLNSDGSLDAGRAKGIAAGPNGVAVGKAGFGPNGAGARLFATNGETSRTWARYTGS